MEATSVQAPPGAAVALLGLRKSYGEVTAVDGVDLVIAPGEVVALLGPNGAGKSTTVDMLVGLTKPDAGEVNIFGVSPDIAVQTGAIGAMLQDGALLDDATVGETVGMIASLHALAAGRTVRAVIPGGITADLYRLPAVSEVDTRGDRVAISTTDSDTTLRALLAAYPGAHDIEVVSVGLEGAFLSLTGEDR